MFWDTYQDDPHEYCFHLWKHPRLFPRLKGPVPLLALQNRKLKKQQSWEIILPIEYLFPTKYK